MMTRNIDDRSIFNACAYSYFVFWLGGFDAGVVGETKGLRAPGAVVSVLSVRTTPPPFVQTESLAIAILQSSLFNATSLRSR